MRRFPATPMRHLPAAILVGTSLLATAGAAQTTQGTQPFQTTQPAAGGPSQGASKVIPPAAIAAKTLAIVNDTRDPAVTKGAETALGSWGQFKVVDDPQLADITLRFEKSREREGASTQKANADTGKTDYGYSMSFSSQIRMNAFLKDGDTPFFATRTDDSKTKAGMSCINDFHTAYRSARREMPAP